MDYVQNEEDGVRLGSRETERARVMATIVLRSAMSDYVAILRDLSETGACIETLSANFQPGDIVQLRLPFLPADQPGEISWTKGAVAGVRFCFPIDRETFRLLAHSLELTDRNGTSGTCSPTPSTPPLQTNEVQRSMERADVAIGATCRTQFGARGLVAMIDLTPQGCCLFGRGLSLSPAQRLSLQPEGLATMKAIVQWNRHSLTGVFFERALHPAVFSHLASTYPWPLPETMKCFGPPR